MVNDGSRLSASKPRVSNIGFSTVTSATGLPTIVAEPNRARSSSFWKAHDAEQDDSSEEASPSNTPKKSSDGIVMCAFDKTSFNMTEIENDKSLDQLSNWAFPIFDYFGKYNSTLMTRVAWRLFKQTNLTKIFKISPQKFVNFFHALESGYRDIPYHNRMHATDVLHSVYYLTHHPVQMVQCDEERTDNEEPTTPHALTTTVKQQSLASCMSALELMALFTAAAMHDYDHPGRTNAFLVAVEDQKAILYNDRSVLENHHAASAWSLLSKTENYFIDHLDAAEAKRFRYIVLELILATDLKRHFEIIMDFNSKVKSDAMNLDDETDRLLATEMLIKMADINAPAKPRDLHLKWTNRIVEEFYVQGDDEKSRGLSVSPYMDREEPQVAKLQTSFISHMVLPLTNALEEAGLLPLLRAETPHATEHSQEENDNESELITYLKRNHARWQAEIEDNDLSSEDTKKDNKSDKETPQPEMETIAENEEEESEPQTLV